MRRQLDRHAPLHAIFAHFTIALTASSLAFDVGAVVLGVVSLAAAGWWTLATALILTLFTLGSGDVRVERLGGSAPSPVLQPGRTSLRSDRSRVAEATLRGCQSVSPRTLDAGVEIARRRLANQHLASPTLADAAAVVRALGAVQAQDYAGAKWALSMRTRGRPTDDVIEEAVRRGSIIRTHVLRPTWHFVAPADLRWMLALTAPRVSAAMAHYNRKLELDSAVFRRSNAALTRALRDGQQLTRAELAAFLRKARVNVDGTQRLGHLMMQAELDAVVCSGARRGKQFTYALLDERVPAAAPLERDEALLELTRRYFATRSPATPHDFAWWSGLTVADATRGIQLAGSALEREIIADRTYWVDPSSHACGNPSSTAYLLPNYDEFFIGFKDRSASARRLESANLVTGGSALIAHVITIDGQLVGGWKRAVEKDAVVVTLNVLTPLTRAEQRALRSALEAYGRFLGTAVDVRQQGEREGGGGGAGGVPPTPGGGGGGGRGAPPARPPTPPPPPPRT